MKEYAQALGISLLVCTIVALAIFATVGAADGEQSLAGFLAGLGTIAALSRLMFGDE